MKILLFLLLTAVASAAPMHVSLPTVMKLAGANNDEIQQAQVKHTEMIAESKQAWQRFWPTLSLNAGYRGHEGRVQDIAGAVFDARKQQYTLGTAILVDWSPGDIYYSALAAKQKAIAAEELAEKTRRDILQESVARYYDLLATEADMAVIEDDLRLTEDYANQLSGAVTAGTAFRADLLRVKTQVSRAKISVRQGQEKRDLAAAALAETLRLAPDTALRPAKSDLVPVSLVSTHGVATLISQAHQNRPELRAASAANTAAVLESDRTRIAPIIPSVQAGYSLGGLGGGFAGEWGNFNDQQDFFLGLGWKIGPGGLFDRQRQKIAEAREQGIALQTSQVKAAIGREVVEAALKAQSSKDQLQINEEAVTAAEEMVQLAKDRQASQLGVVLEYLLAREELTRARQGRVKSVTDYNKAQHALKRAVGK
ncbi:TolC family protein [Prosthecobacter dejongeii]|uniref:Outer membrane protein TolC n=1 Tax=Prosthecobacter dejongeii TaxID=48465 RepID=A0A7W8DPV8_9BACT|nr:TolC family protein [Prosthecobacter dejongeii]MBB5038059.1 outer membrane protein TolC [Prosthecobacter dejongeii]